MWAMVYRLHLSSTFLYIIIVVCDVHEWIYLCYGMNVKVRGQISGVRALLKHLDLGTELRFLGLYSKCFYLLSHLDGQGLISF